MGELKTRRTDDSVDALIASITDDSRREDCLALVELMRKVTGEDPAVWGSSIVGFGTFHYKSKSGQEGDWFPVGFANRKAAITIYLGVSLEESAEFLAGLGKHKTGKGCIYVKRLADVDTAVLGRLVADSYARTKQTYG